MQMPGEALILKMWESLIEKGIGGLISPYYTVWKNKKLTLGAIELDKISKIAISEGEKEIAELNNKTNLIGYESTTALENESEVSVRDMVLSNDIKRLIREEINIAQAINHANQRLIEDSSDLPEKEISQDWLHMWRDNARKVSDEEVQSLWGNVLAQEFIEPGRYSLRLLDFLKTISKADALLIEKFAPFLIQKHLIYGVKQNDETEFSAEFGFSVGELNFLEEMNLVSGTSTLGMIATLKNKKEQEGVFETGVIIDKNRAMLLSDDNKDKVARFKYFPVTKIGQEVFSLIDMSVSTKYIDWLVKQYTKDFKVEMYVSENGVYTLESTFEKDA